MLDKFKNVCLIDNKIIENAHGRGVVALSRYLMLNYNMTLKDYIIKYYYNNTHPVCACGCGTPLNFSKGKFRKYFNDHKNYVGVSQETIEKQKEGRKKRNTLEYRLKSLNKTKEDIFLLYDKFINFNENFTDITKNYKIDKRTLKKLWIELGLIKDKNQFENIVKKHQRLWANKNDNRKQKIDEDVLLNVYFFIKNNKRKYTLNEITLKFNLAVSSLVLFRRLSENFGEELIKEYLKHGLSSNSEIEYYNVLKYFFGKKIKKGFVLFGKHYDFILNEKILIEFDGDYWHNQLKNIENDKLKDRLAIENGYKIFRVKESESKDINILLKLQNLYENKI